MQKTGKGRNWIFTYMKEVKDNSELITLYRKRKPRYMGYYSRKSINGTNVYTGYMITKKMRSYRDIKGLLPNCYITRMKGPIWKEPEYAQNIGRMTEHGKRPKLPEKMAAVVEEEEAIKQNQITRPMDFGDEKSRLKITNLPKPMEIDGGNHRQTQKEETKEREEKKEE